MAALKHLHANCLPSRPMILLSALLPLSANILTLPSKMTLLRDDIFHQR
uniref:Uncharacterized protein n=1 Tax=Parascaris equorum TaxID=6256 RepID=A0A914RBI8_PAREQ